MLVLDFYGLESLQPQVWSGGSADNLSPGAVSPDNSRATAAGDVFSMAMPLASMETADNKPSTDGSSAPQADRADREWDDSDPLGIKDSLSAALAQKDASVATRSRRKSVLPRKIRRRRYM